MDGLEKRFSSLPLHVLNQQDVRSKVHFILNSSVLLQFLKSSYFSKSNTKQNVIIFVPFRRDTISLCDFLQSYNYDVLLWWFSHIVFSISWRFGYISKKEKPEDIHSFISITSYHHCNICFWIRCESPKYNSMIVDECVIVVCYSHVRNSINSGLYSTSWPISRIKSRCSLYEYSMWFYLFQTVFYVL